MKLFIDIFDLKVTFLYSIMLGLIQSLDIDFAYKVISGLIFIGYNLHRWYIMWKNDKISKNNTNNKRTLR